MVKNFQACLIGKLMIVDVRHVGVHGKIDYNTIVDANNTD